MSKTNQSFADRMKEHQIAWATRNGFTHLLDPRNNSQPSWVLKPEHQTKNLQNPTWWQYIKGREHKWARSLLSSQCFAVNVFGPLVENPILAKRVLESLFPHRILEKDDNVSVFFEHTPEGTRKWLGETKTSQPTQVDVFFTVTRRKQSVGHVLVEVKYTELEFGSCRGAVPPPRRLATMIRLDVLTFKTYFQTLSRCAGWLNLSMGDTIGTSCCLLPRPSGSLQPWFVHFDTVFTS